MSSLVELTRATSRRSERRLWLLWVVATALPVSVLWIAAYWLAFQNVVANPEAALYSASAIFSLSPIWCGFLVLFGPLVGVAQGLALRLAGWKGNWGTWVPAGFAGGFIVLLFMVAITSRDVFLFIWASLLPGFTLGAIQEPALRKHSGKTIWWVLANGAAWIVALLVGASMLGVARGFVVSLANIHTDTHFDDPYYPLESFIAWSTGWTAGAFTYAALTGLALIWLLRQPPKVIVTHQRGTS